MMKVKRQCVTCLEYFMVNPANKRKTCDAICSKKYLMCMSKIRANSPPIKAYRKAYWSDPKRKEKTREYRKQSNVKARAKILRDTPERKKKVKDYLQRPDIMIRTKKRLDERMKRLKKGADNES